MSTSAEAQADQVDVALGAALSINVDLELPPPAANSRQEHVDGDSRKTITVTPFRGKQVAGLLRCINDLVAAGIDLSNLESMENFSALITQAPDIAFKLLAEAITPEPNPIKRPAAVNVSIDLVGYQQIEELTTLGHAVWTVNKNYFQKKGPALLALLGIDPAYLEELKATWIGAQSSPASSPADTV